MSTTVQYVAAQSLKSVLLNQLKTTHDKHTWFTIGAAGSLHLIQGAPANISRDKNDHLCFSVKSIDEFIANLDKHKIEYTNWPGTAKAPTVRVDGVKQIYFVDPDGHWIEINDDIKK